jgi:hypothetical protein
MAWSSTATEGIIISKRRAPAKEIQHGTYQYRIITISSVTTVTEYPNMTYAAADSLAGTSGWNDVTIDTDGRVTASSQADVVRQNEADAYKVVRTQLAVTVSVGAWTNNPT